MPNDDSEWQRLDRQRNDFAAAHKWARYRNITLRMAQLRGRQGRLEDSLVTYLELCYIDINGAQNAGAAWGVPIHDFDPDRAFGLGPLIVRRVNGLARDLGYDQARLKVEFLATASVLHRSLSLPVTPEDAWQTLRYEIYRE
ncbi:MAG TPA: hypothetical protein VMJ64_13920 [Anaerolineales bacterium]|nr:hypothetical protein [Anaerolineales bacterium]